MKTLKQHLNEVLKINSKSKVIRTDGKYFTLEEFICKFQGVKSLSELTQDDMEAYDLGFIWFGDDFADLTIDELLFLYL